MLLFHQQNNEKRTEQDDKSSLLKFIDVSRTAAIKQAENMQYSSQLHERWIVVTTIQHPTVQMSKLASLKGWKMVVVGDVSTPANWR